MGEMRWVAAVIALSGGPEIEPRVERVIGDVVRIEGHEEVVSTFPFKVAGERRRLEFECAKLTDVNSILCFGGLQIGSGPIA